MFYPSFIESVVTSPMILEWKTRIQSYWCKPTWYLPFVSCQRYTEIQGLLCLELLALSVWSGLWLVVNVIQSPFSSIYLYMLFIWNFEFGDRWQLDKTGLYTSAYLWSIVLISFNYYWLPSIMPIAAEGHYIFTLMTPPTSLVKQNKSNTKQKQSRVD